MSLISNSLLLSPRCSQLKCSIITSKLSNKHKRSVHKPKGRWELYKLILIHLLHLWESVMFLSTLTHFHCIIYPRLLYLSSVALGCSPDCQLRSVSLYILCCLIFLSPLHMTDGPQIQMVSFFFFTNDVVGQCDHIPQCLEASETPRWSVVLRHFLCSKYLKKKALLYKDDKHKQQIKRYLGPQLLMSTETWNQPSCVFIHFHSI